MLLHLEGLQFRLIDHAAHHREHPTPTPPGDNNQRASISRMQERVMLTQHRLIAHHRPEEEDLHLKNNQRASYKLFFQILLYALS